MRIRIPMLTLTAHGGARVLVALANLLVSRGHEVEVITSGYPEGMPFVFDRRVRVRRLGFVTTSRALALVCFLCLSPFYLRRSLIVANYFWTVLPSWLCSKLFGSKYIYLVQDTESRFFKKRRHWPLRAICHWTYARGRVIAANPYLAGELKRHAAVLLTLNLGVAERFLTQPRKTSGATYDVVYFLRSQALKRLDRFDEILASLKPKAISVLCISQDKTLLASYADRAGTACPENDEELIDLIDSARMLLLTSEHEGFALPPLEAMARGLPCVMYECGGPGVYARDGRNAFVVRDGRSATAVAFIERLRTDEANYRSMSAEARATAAAFRLDRAVGELAAYIEESVSGAASSVL